MNDEIKRVFVVDDDESVCRALKFLLTTFGFQVSTFLSPDKFFSDVTEGIKGTLLLDIHMPGWDGWETLKRIVKSGSKRPVIVISADKNGGLMEKALGIGAVGFFQKPINDEELVDLINKTYIKEGLGL